LIPAIVRRVRERFAVAAAGTLGVLAAQLAVSDAAAIAPRIEPNVAEQRVTLHARVSRASRLVQAGIPRLGIPPGSAEGNDAAPLPAQFPNWVNFAPGFPNFPNFPNFAAPPQLPFANYVPPFANVYSPRPILPFRNF
jgi:hypothetical protein